MATTVKMHEAETHLSSLSRAAEGEEIVIARGDKPQVMLVPVKETPKFKREPGRRPARRQGAGGAGGDRQ